MTGTDNVRVRGRNAEEVSWSRKAARRAGFIRGQMDEAPPADGVYIAETITAVSLEMLGPILDAEHVEPASLAGLSTAELWAFVNDADYLNAIIALELAQHEVAQRMNGNSVQELRELLCATDEGTPADERAAALAEPAFIPCADAAGNQSAAAANAAAPIIDEDDVQILALGSVALGTLVKLKGVSRMWAEFARRALCSRLCCRDEAQRRPAKLADVTTLNIEDLKSAGRASDVALAGHLLPNLEWLHGDGFQVSVATLRGTELPARAGASFDGAVLRSCITGEREPPLELLLMAVACAGSGRVGGIPVQQLRDNNAIGDLDLSGVHLNPDGAWLLALLLPRATSVRKLKCA
jgi:hypothetical protein